MTLELNFVRAGGYLDAMNELEKPQGQKQPLEVFCKKGVLKNVSKFTGKHLRRGIFFNKGAG